VTTSPAATEPGEPRTSGDDPLVSIVMPARNCGSLIADAIRSVRAQTYTNWELLIADDGSTDDTAAVLGAIRDGRIRVSADGRQRGAAARLNELLHAAKGSYAARLDADDLMHPRRIERQLRTLQRCPDVDVLGTTDVMFLGRDELVGRTRSVIPAPYTRAAALSGVQPNGPTVMGATRFFRSNPYDPDYRRSEDLELACRTAPTARFASLDEDLYFYREFHSPKPRKYVLGYLMTDRILRVYGPAEVGRIRTMGLRLRNSLAMARSVSLILGGGHTWLVRRGTERLSSAAEAEARQALETIYSTDVSGLDPTR